jgi:DNA-nicking Smr family endonuclease
MAAPPPAEFSPDDDADLFRAAVADAKPVADNGRARLRKPAPKPIPHQLLKDEQRVLKEALEHPVFWDEGLEHADTVSFLRPGLPRKILRRLRAGDWTLQHELDLHGLRTDEAKSYLIEFLAECLRQGVRCVRIVHGKGLRSKNREPVLKNKVRHWLMQRDEILAFIEPHAAAGGSGAVVVLLKSSI